MRNIESLEAIGAPLVDRTGAWKMMHNGLLGFCWGDKPISAAIEKATQGPSHVFLVWQPLMQSVWLTLEETFERGAHVGLLSDYIDGSDGDLLFCRRVDENGVAIDMTSTIDTLLELLDERYATVDLIQNGLHRLLKLIPAAWNVKESYCSGYQWHGSQSSRVPFPAPDGAPTPSDLLQHWSSQISFGLPKLAAKGATA